MWMSLHWPRGSHIHDHHNLNQANRFFLSSIVIVNHEKLSHQLKINCKFAHLISISVSAVVKTIIATIRVAVIVCERSSRFGRCW